MENGDAITAGAGAILVAILSAAGYGLRNIVAAWFKRVELWISTPTPKPNTLEYCIGVRGLRKVLHFTRLLELASQLEFIDRILIFEGANCGGSPSPGKAYNVSCNWSYCVNENKHPELLYAGPLRVDSHYIKMLLEMIENRYVQLTTVEMHPAAMLRRYYEKEGVVQSRVYFLSFDEEGKCLMFCTIANYSRAFTDSEAGQIDMVVDRLRGLMGVTELKMPVLKQ